MATLIKHRNQYFSKIQKWNGIKQIATYIPLKTNKKNYALARHSSVENQESHIKDRTVQKHQFKEVFPWLNKEGTSIIKLLTISEAIEQFIDSYKANVSDSSIKRIVISLNRALDVWKGNTPISHIKIESIESFIAVGNLYSGPMR